MKTIDHLILMLETALEHAKTSRDNEKTSHKIIYLKGARKSIRASARIVTEAYRELN